MPIQVKTRRSGIPQWKAAFRKNHIHYLREALGLALFMIAACFFGSFLFSPHSPWITAIPGMQTRSILMGIAMGATALFLFYSPLTAPSGSHINPAVTLSFLRLGKMCPYDAFFYIVFQVAGGTAAVAVMQLLLGTPLTGAPVHSVATLPGPHGIKVAFITELLLAFLTMSLVLFTTGNPRLKNYSRLLAAGLVACWVIIATPLSGFGMNPARSLASAIPSGNWTAIWLYLLAPPAGMLGAAELYRVVEKRKANNHYPKGKKTVPQKRYMEPFEFML